MSLHRKGNPEEPGNYLGITLLSTLGMLFTKVLNNRKICQLLTIYLFCMYLLIT